MAVSTSSKTSNAANTTISVNSVWTEDPHEVNLPFVPQRPKCPQ